MDDQRPPWPPPAWPPPAVPPAPAPGWSPAPGQAPAPGWSPPPGWQPPPGWHPGPSLPPARPPAGRRRRAWALVAVAGLVLGGNAVLGRLAPGGPSWADAWDPRVEPLARFVEQARGLPFEHPVEVAFVPEDEFLAEIREERAARRAAGDGAGGAPGPDALPFERAFGLVPEGFEPARADDDEAAGVVGAYDPWTRRIRLRGTELTPSVRVTLVHELTHALQDQHFDLREVQSRPQSNAAALAVLSVIEGDATLVEQAYVDGLSDAELEALGAAEGEVVAAPELDRVPVAVLAEVQMPYVLGPSLVGAVDVLGAAGDRDELFRSPPTSDTAVLFPDRFVEDTLVVAAPEVPELAAGEEAVDPGRYGDDLGAFTWVTVLAGRLPPGDAVAAVAGLTGDRYVTFRRDGRVCARANLATVDDGATAALRDAFTTWARLGPSGAVDVASAGRTVTVTACAVGPVAPEDDDRFDDPLVLLDLRNGAFAVPAPLGRSDATLAERRCLGDEYAGGFSLVELSDLAAVPSERFAAVGREAGLACGLVG